MPGSRDGICRDDPPFAAETRAFIGRFSIEQGTGMKSEWAKIRPSKVGPE
jgi:hypothetical protein